MEVARIHEVCVARECTTPYSKLRLNSEGGSEWSFISPERKKRKFTPHAPYRREGEVYEGESIGVKENAGAPFEASMRSFDL